MIPWVTANRKQRFFRVLLAAFLVLMFAVSFVAFGNIRAEPKPLVFVGFTNQAGAFCAMFRFQGTDISRFSNLTSWENQVADVVGTDAAGVSTTNSLPLVRFDLKPDGTREIGIAIPPSAVRFTVTYSHRQRQGRVSHPPTGPPRVQFYLPWAKREIFRSGVIEPLATQ